MLRLRAGAVDVGKLVPRELRLSAGAEELGYGGPRELRCSGSGDPPALWSSGSSGPRELRWSACAEKLGERWCAGTGHSVAEVRWSCGAREEVYRGS